MKMGKKSSMLSFLWVALVGVLLVSGCRSTDVDAGVYGSDNLYGDPLIADIPLNDLEGLPTDGDRSMFAAVYFGYDSAAVNPADALVCEAVANYLRGQGGVILEGHADERGSRDYNLSLGERRALAVRSYLIELGVNPSQIQTRSFGEEQPANQNHDETAWSENRRVEFAIY
ncbi:MAG: peptidoglycan-associated lipoprotein [Kiritimatiellaceae bacterium]|nr:MAG: peptidoglycan-associated lipoprotein [Kiritimatiellaceae bacterium]